MHHRLAGFVEAVEHVAARREAELIARVVGRLARLAHDDVSAAQFSALDDLRRAATAPGPLDALELADRETELAGWLERHGVPDAWGIAAGLVAGGIDVPWAERAQGKDAHEFAPVADLTLHEAAE